MPHSCHERHAQLLICARWGPARGTLRRCAHDIGGRGFSPSWARTRGIRLSTCERDSATSCLRRPAEAPGVVGAPGILYSGLDPAGFRMPGSRQLSTTPVRGSAPCTLRPLGGVHAYDPANPPGAKGGQRGGVAAEGGAPEKRDGERKRHAETDAERTNGGRGKKREHQRRVWSVGGNPTGSASDAATTTSRCLGAWTRGVLQSPFVSPLRPNRKETAARYQR